MKKFYSKISIFKVLIILITLSLLTISCSNMEISNRAACPKFADSPAGHIKKFLYYASLAGSAFNSQAWRVIVHNNDSLDIFIDDSKSPQSKKPTRQYLCLSIGGFVENFEIAAANCGYACEINIDNESDGFTTPAATIKISKQEGLIQNITLDDLAKRRTLRVEYKKDEIDYETLQKIVGSSREKILYFDVDSETGNYLNENMQKMADALMGKNYSKNLIDNTRGWIVFMAEDTSQSNLIYAGRLNERANIICNKLGIGFQAMNFITVNKKASEELGRFIKSPMLPVLMARIGRLDLIPAPVSERRSVEEFTTFK